MREGFIPPPPYAANPLLIIYPNLKGYMINMGSVARGPIWNLSSRNRATPSPFRMEFSMRSLSQQYRRSLQRHRQFLRSYWWSLLHCCDPWGDRCPRCRRCRSLPIVARLAKHCKTSWNTLKTLWNIMKHSNTCHLMCWYQRSMHRHRRSHGVSVDIGAEVPAISAIVW